MTNKDFEGKYALITGATSGMGARTATMMAERGLAGLIISGRNEERAEQVKAECEKFGTEVHLCLGDITVVENVKKVTDFALATFPKIDILVNAAGVSPYDDPWNIEDVEHFDLIINTNLRSQFLFIQPIVKQMVENGYGKVVNYASCVARTGSGISLSYAASKGGILAMTRSLAKVVGKFGVNVNAILPGVIDTPMCAGHDYSEPAKAWPIPRMGTADELAEATCFLASDRASYMQGAGMDVNGGYVMG